MDCRVKPGNDVEGGRGYWAWMMRAPRGKTLT
jgi:hypothetical protein